MADGYTKATEGSFTFASDDVNGVHTPRMKLVIGADGTVGDVSASNPVPTAPYLSNGVTNEQERGNHEVTVLASAARTANINSADQTNYNAKGVIVTIDATALTLTPGVTFKIQEKDSLSGVYTDLLTSAAVTGVSTTKLVVYPGVTVAANVALSRPLPRVWRVVATVIDTDSLTYSVSANYVL